MAKYRAYRPLWLLPLSCLLIFGGLHAGFLQSVLAKTQKPWPVAVGDNTIWQLDWSQPLVRSDLFRKVQVSFGSPAISLATKMVIAGSAEGRVLAFALDDGRLLFSYDQEIPLATAATIVKPRQPLLKPEPTQEIALLTNRLGNLLAFALPTFKLLWQVNLGADIQAPLKVVYQTETDVLLARNLHNTLTALDLATGKTLWSWTKNRLTTQHVTLEGESSPTISPKYQSIFMSFADGEVAALNLLDGLKIWQRSLSNYTFIKENNFIDALADPIIVEDILYVASYGTGVYALNPKTGDTLWFKDLKGVTSLAAIAPNTHNPQGAIAVGSVEGKIWGLNLANGEPLFTTTLNPGSISRLVNAFNLLIFTSSSDGLVVLNAANGKPLQATSILEERVGDPVLVGDRLAFISGSGVLYMYHWRR